MHILWGTLMLLIGLLMALGAYFKSEFILYRLIHARASQLWKDNAHTFLLVSGIIISLFSLLFFFNIF